MAIIDVHVHAFPDDLAARAIPQLEAGAGVAARLDGTVSALLRSMDRAGIARAVICSIATRPGQFQKILDWSLQVRSARLVPLPSVHPSHPEALAQVRAVKDAGLPGIKIHPYYQDFYLDDPRLAPFFACIEDCGLLVLCHTGFDIAFPRERRADPERILRVAARHPGLRLIATHLGAWEDWDEVERRLIGRPVLLETSFALGYAPPERVRRMLLDHPADCILFGSDSPWADQAEELERLRALGLPPEREAALLGGNAARLLGP